ncbi:MAG: VOC family protein [Sphingomonadaceae bacterium]
MDAPVDFIEMTPMLPVADLDRSLAFYRDMLSFEPASRSDKIVLLRKGGASLYLVPESPPTPDKPGVTIALSPSSSRSPVNLAFRVADLRIAHERLEERGVEFLAPPEVKPWGEIRVFTRDPDGYLIEFYQPLPAEGR